MMEAIHAFDQASSLEKSKLTVNCCDSLFSLCCSKAHKRHSVFKKGADRVNRHLDITNFLKKQMVLENLFKVQFGPLEQFLARRKYKTFVLDSKMSTIAATSASEGDFSSDYLEQEENSVMRDKHANRMKQRLFEQLKGHQCPQ